MGQEGSKLDRELIELLNELRVALPGVQVLFAFLLIVPFNQGWAKVTSAQIGAYFTAFLCTTAASILLIGPSANHRIEWRAHDKEHLLEFSNNMAIAGLAFLAVAILAVVFFITDFLFGGLTAVLVTAAATLLFALFWYAIPIYRRAKA